MRNDPDFTLLCIGEKGFGDSVCPDSDADWIRLGKLVGENTHLVTLDIGFTGTERKESYEEMLRGVGRNRSLKNIRVSATQLVLGSLCRILSPFIEGNSCLVKFTFDSGPSVDTRSEMHALSSTLSKGSSLKVLDLSYNFMDEDMAEELVPSLAGLSHLEELNLTANNIGLKGCGALSELLRNHMTLREVNLGSNGIGDKEAEALAEGLSDNTVLTKLILSNGNPHQGGDRNSITDKGWRFFVRLLCDKSSVSNTCHSNHTLNSVTHPHSILYARISGGFRYNGFANPLPAKLVSSLKMNENDDKRSVARQKVLKHHEIDSESLEDLLSSVPA